MALSDTKLGNMLLGAGKSVSDGLGLALAQKALSVVTGLTAAALMAYPAYALYDTLYTQQAASAANYAQYKPQIVDDDDAVLGPSALKEINQDYRGWLTIYDTTIDYPVMQGKDDLHYSSHDVFGKTSLTGAIYLASQNSPDFSDTYNVIYGHHMQVGAMFGDLDKFNESGYLNSHHRAIVVGESAVYDVDLFAVVQADAYDTDIYTVGNDRSVNELLSMIRSHKVRQWRDVGTGGNVRILALSTCEDAKTNGRLVVFGVMRERNLTPEQQERLQAQIDSGEGLDDGSGSTAGGGAGNDGSGNGGAGNGGSSNPLSEIIEDENNPLSGLVGTLAPNGHVRANDWALANLLCVLGTLYLLLPVRHLRDKYQRTRLMKRLGQVREALATDISQMSVQGLRDDLRRFTQRLRCGLGLEAVLAVASVVVFVLTQDMRMPMVIIDVWTPVMLALLLAAWVSDYRLIRYRGDLEYAA